MSSYIGDSNNLKSFSSVLVKFCTTNLAIQSIPNIFTPTDDNLNDVFSLTIYGEGAFLIQILNRWGDVVFESDNPNFNWDGIHLVKNEKVSTGTYFYKISLNTYILHGTLTIIYYSRTVPIL